MASKRPIIIAGSIVVGMILAVVVVIGMMGTFHSPAAHTVTVGAHQQTAPKPNQGTKAWPGTTFEDGTFWQLTGLREFPDGKQWWGGDGVVLVREPQVTNAGLQLTAPGMRVMELRFRGTSIEDAFKRRFRFRLDDQKDLRSFTLAQSHIVSTGNALFAVPEAQETIDLQVGIPSGVPVDVIRAELEVTPDEIRATTRPASPPTTSPGNVSFGKIEYDGTRLKVEVFDNRTDDQRFQDGVELGAELALFTKTNKPIRWSAGGYQYNKIARYAFDVKREQIGSIAFQTRTVQWITMPKLPLRPVGATTAPTTVKAN